MALAGLAELERLEGHYSAALQRNDEAEAFFRQRDDQRGISEMLLHRARTLLDLALADEADALLQSVEVDALGSREQRAVWWLLRAHASRRRGEPETAMGLARESVAAAQEAGNRQVRLRAEMALALSLHEAGKKTEAQASWRTLSDLAGSHVSASTQLEAAEVALQLATDDAVERYRVARQQLARVTRYGRAWRLHALAATRLSTEADRSWSANEAARAFGAILDQAPERAHDPLRAAARELGLRPEQ